MEQEELIEEFCKLSDIRILLLNHPNRKMILDSCLHYMGDKVQHLFSKNFDVEVCWEIETPHKDKAITNAFVINEVSWKSVFNSNAANFYTWKDITHVSQAAKNAGYKYFAWNQHVYSVATGHVLYITVNDLDKKS